MPVSSTRNSNSSPSRNTRGHHLSHSDSVNFSALKSRFKRIFSSLSSIQHDAWKTRVHLDRQPYLTRVGGVLNARCQATDKGVQGLPPCARSSPAPPPNVPGPADH